MKDVLIFLIRFYQKYLSRLKKPCCRFYPSCSQYSLEAIKKYGALKGFYFSVKRILRCNPFCRGGYDPLK